MKQFPAAVSRHLIIAVTLSAFSAPSLASEGTLYVGWAEVVITPPREVALVGQKRPRISGQARDPLTATVLALETKQEGRSLEQAVMINLAAPSQETEGISEVSADFWHEVRQEVRNRHTADWFIFPQCAASGDISPHLMFRKRAEQIMLERKGISSRQEIALRIADALDTVLPYSKSGIKRKLQLAHRILHLDLPRADPSRKPPYPIDGGGKFRVHVMRVGDVALVSVPFELYLEYSIRIQARSPAVLTFTVQLASQLAGYLPTTEAVAGGGYSADQFLVGPEGGDVLVEEVLKTIHSLFRSGI